MIRLSIKEYPDFFLMIVEAKGGNVDPIRYRQINLPNGIFGKGLAIAPTNTPLLVTAPIIAKYHNLVPWIGIYSAKFQGICVTIETGYTGIIKSVLPYTPFCRECGKETGELFFCAEHRNMSITRQSYTCKKTTSAWNTEVVYLE